ncbi:MAG TPA: methylglyoxal synthase, partial [Balneolaceae bacterium]|nr:methylglyoxal synthase [Balneolaceae bacterium]
MNPSIADSVQPMKPKKNIALIAHDHRKADLL